MPLYPLSYSSNDCWYLSFHYIFCHKQLKGKQNGILLLFPILQRLQFLVSNPSFKSQHSTQLNCLRLFNFPHLHLLIRVHLSLPPHPAVSDFQITYLNSQDASTKSVGQHRKNMYWFREFSAILPPTWRSVTT